MPDLSVICICGHQARRHHPEGHAHAFTCSLCSCMYLEPVPIPDHRPLDIALTDALRCTAHIEENAIRAKYLITDLGLRGWVMQRVVRDERGHFAKAYREDTDD